METTQIAKLINCKLYEPTEGERKKIVITNPTTESLKFNLGYKDVVYDEEPEYDPETEMLVPEYEETEVAILVHYNVVPIPQPEPEVVEEEPMAEVPAPELEEVTEETSETEEEVEE